MGIPSLKPAKPKTVYLNPRENFQSPNPQFVRMSPENLAYFVGEGQIERAIVYKTRRDGSLKEVRIWRACDAMYKTRYDVRGQSCSAGPAYTEKLAQGLVNDQNWARQTIKLFRFHAPVVRTPALQL